MDDAPGATGAGRELWSAGPRTLRLWDLRTRRLLRELDGAAPLGAVFPPLALGGAGADSGGITGACVVCLDPDGEQVVLGPFGNEAAGPHANESLRLTTHFEIPAVVLDSWFNS